MGKRADSPSPDLDKSQIVPAEKDEADAGFARLGSDLLQERVPISFRSPWLSEHATVFSPDHLHHNFPLSSLSSHLDSSILAHLPSSITAWFPVQAAVIPALASPTASLFPACDLAISAPTGSGKTLCYVLPIVHHLRSRIVPVLAALVVAPMQNLVEQIASEFRHYAPDLRILHLTGNREVDTGQLHDCDVLVATPDRLLSQLLFDGDLRRQMGTLRYLVIDEADRLLPDRQAWLPMVEEFANVRERLAMTVDAMERTRSMQKILVSATLLMSEEQLNAWNLFQPRLFRSGDAVGDNDETGLALPVQLEQSVLQCASTMKPLVLFLSLETHSEWKKVLCFTGSKNASRRLVILLNALAGACEIAVEMSSNLFGHRRHKVLKRFSTGKIRVLICSDLLSRGVHLEDVQCVVNYDMPANVRAFVHRSGRTARATAAGHVLSLCNESEMKSLSTMLSEKSLWKNVEVMSISDEKLEEYKEKYASALKKLKQVVQEGGKGGKNREKTRK